MSELVEPGDRVGVGDPGKGSRHSLQGRAVALQLLQLLLAALQRPGDDVADERFLQPHVGIGVIEGHLGLHHPELGQVSAGLRLLGSKGGAEAVDLPQGGGRRLDVELPGLREVCLAEVEIVGREEISRLLTDRSRQDRRVHQGEPLLVEVVADGLLDLVAHPGDRGLPAAPEPQVSMLEEESRPMFFGGDRILEARAEDLEAGHRQLVPARRARLFPHDPGQRDAGLLRQGAERRPDGLRDLLLG
jgi:hypothetical protein